MHINEQISIYAKHGEKFCAIVQTLGSEFAVFLVWLFKEHTCTRASHNELNCAGNLQVIQAFQDVSRSKLLIKSPQV